MQKDIISGLDAIKEIADSINISLNGEVGKAHFSYPDYQALPLVPENIKPINSTKPVSKMAFIDGGNQEILSAPNFSVQINRIYFCMFKGKERILPNNISSKIEFFSATRSRFSDGRIYYDTDIFPIGNVNNYSVPESADLSFDSADRTVTVGNQRADITRVASIARRFAEWKFAAYVIENEMDSGDFVVTDGSLEAAFTNETKYLENMFSAGDKKRVIVTGLSKTSRLFTTTGLSLLGAVQQVADSVTFDKWYIPLAKSKSLDHEAAMFAVKLNNSAERIFRFEIQREQFVEMSEKDVGNLLGQLATNAVDISFPGYPYGLITSDTHARVREEEALHYRTVLMSEISKTGNWKKLVQHLKSIDAHEHLNSVVG